MQTLLPSTLQLLIVPFDGPPHSDGVMLTPSTSVTGKHTVITESSGMVTVVSGITGASFTGVMLIYT